MAFILHIVALKFKAEYTDEQVIKHMETEVRQISVEQSFGGGYLLRRSVEH